MTAGTEQIVTLYESCGMSPNEIATSEGIDELAIKSVLVKHSPIYRKSLPKEEKKALFDDEVLQEAAIEMRSLLSSDEDGVRYRAAKFIINEVKGRHDNVKNLLAQNSGSVNVFLINEQLARAKEAIARSKQNSKIVELEEAK